MIHYSCDLCKRELDPEHDSRYAVQIEISQVIEPLDTGEEEGDRDYLQEIQDVLEQCDEDDPLLPLCDGAPRNSRYDLCAECCKKVLRHPLGRDGRKQFNFSPN
jgi:hypothetical protein